MKKAVLGIVLCFSFAASGFSMGFSLKLTGGAAYISGGEYNDAVDGTNAFYAAYYATASGTLSKLHFGMSFGGELILNIDKNWGIGLGAGYMQFSHDTQTITGNWSIFGFPITDTITLKPAITTIPITLNVHCTLPMGGLNLNLFAGAGYYISKMKIERGFQSTFLLLQTAATFDSNSIGGQIGFQGGLGLEIPLGANFAFIIDITGRYVNLSDIKGDYTFTGSILGLPAVQQSGPDAYFQTFEEILSGTWYKLMDWTTDAARPSGSHYRNGAHSKFDLTGVSGQAGFKIGF